MPTTLPRLQLTMQPDLYAAISRLSSLTGQSKARVILDVIEPALPFFNEAARLVESAKELKAEPSKQLVENLARLGDKITAQPDGLSPRAAALMAELASELEAVRDPAPRTVTRGALLGPTSPQAPSFLPSLPLKSLS